MSEQDINRRTVMAGAVAGIGLAAIASGAVSTARAQSASKTYVLIHGSFCGGWYWRRVADILEKQGHKVFAPTLAGLGEHSHLLNKDINLDTHITDIVNLSKWENLDNVCLVAHSYAGWPASGALEQIGDRVSSIVWLDALKPADGQKAIDVVNPAIRKAAQDAAEKGEPGLKPAPSALFLLNEKDQPYADAKFTAQPVGTYLQPIKLAGARDKVAKKTYIRAVRWQAPAFDKALAECKADPSWRTVTTDVPGHIVMLDAPEWLAGQLLQAA